MYIADLHIHSRYSRATSRDCTPEYLDLWARRKGIDLLGTGDFTHPAWRQELEEKLVPAEDGLYVLKEDLRIRDQAPEGGRRPRFVVSGEISSIYKKNGRVRKVHNVILLPGLKEAEKLAEKLETIGNIHSDGRPILGLDCRDLLEITLEICPRAIFVPAHIWTPHFSVFGAFSGFDTMEECFEELTPYIRAIETGLSSDPPMNWRLSALDRFQMISNSDAHSPAKLGREANLLEIDMSYDGLYGAIQEGKGLKGTIEFFPEEGKYHFDGHRKCHLCLSPREAENYQGKCPVCGKKLTLGVSHRIEQLADRQEGFHRAEARPFESLVPLPEVIAASTGHSAASMKVQKQYEEMLGNLGTEFDILRNVPVKEIHKKAGYLISEGIRRLREGKVRRFPGFDGEYGTVQLFEPSELDMMDGQMSMFAGTGWMSEKEKTLAEEGTLISAKKEKEEAAEKEEKPNPEAAEKGEKPNSETVEKKETALNPGEGTEDTLNPEQSQAVCSVSPRIAVIAGPGTGKTKTLVSRILYLLQTRRVKPSEITAVTFTKKAAEEMRSRLEGQLGGKQAVRKLQIGTFHSVCNEFLRNQGETFILADEALVLDIAEEVVKETEREFGRKIKPGRLLSMISERKNAAQTFENGKDEPPKAAAQEEACYESAAELYQTYLKKMNALDFDDLLLRTLRLVEGGCVDSALQPFRYLLVDEFQDISPLQYRLIQAWSGGGRELFIIGDPDQAIYGFRGADARSFERFCREQDTEVIRLRKNYRSTPQILKAAQTMMFPHQPPVLEPMRAPGCPVRLTKASGDMAEAIFTAREINRLVGGIDMLDAQEGFSCADNQVPRSFSDIAILYRTHRQAELLEKCLRKEGIPYVVTGREEFLEEPGVRECLRFFRSILAPSCQMPYHKPWEACKKQVSQNTGGEFAEKFRKMCRRSHPQTVIKAWIEEMGMEENSSMEKLLAMAVFHKTMAQFLDSLVFGRESDLRRCGGKTYTADSVTLMTLHGSKGLEFPVVFLYGARKGLIPLDYGKENTDFEEERRLFYVGMTRAKEELILSVSGEESPFLKNLSEGEMIREKAAQKEHDSYGGRQMSLFEFMV